MHKHLILASGLLLFACSPGETPAATEKPTGDATTPVSEAPSSGESPLASDLRILGTEPFWAIEISKTANSAAFSRPGEADIALGFPTESSGPDGASILTSSSPHGDAVMTLWKKDCSDGMSDRVYPWTAEVAFKGETLKGCAATPEFIRQTPQ